MRTSEVMSDRRTIIPLDLLLALRSLQADKHHRLANHCMACDRWRPSKGENDRCPHGPRRPGR
ncbi:hypothetical protein Arub01_11610 [Actinomadura rubrobrunea]|uniref:Uncharacterized protein n=1 Tax=Actinomadura rubrobrunea TaxID=115335 RepID=A0A9W6PSX6_9ACTN|nr:hypothetical protein Arub01_11610 [Actinomadura rubrobrunea]